MKRCCEDCGQPGRVQILEGYRAGAPVMRVLCMPCADHACVTPPETDSPAARGRLSPGATVILGGVCLGLFALLRQHVGLGQAAGFGVEARLAACLGALLVLLGALLRADVVAVVGTLVFGVAAGAGLFGPVDAVHVGLVSRSGIAVSLGLIAVGLALRWRAS
jgi:hypothetical protein